MRVYFLYTLTKLFSRTFSSRTLFLLGLMCPDYVLYLTRTVAVIPSQYTIHSPITYTKPGCAQYTLDSMCAVPAVTDTVQGTTADLRL